MKQQLPLILQFLEKKINLNFFGYRLSVVENRVCKRLEETQSASYAEYLDFLEKNPDETHELLDALTINVSRFFRNTWSFEVIDHQILPAILLKKMEQKNSSLRIWSAGCSHGEEAYSIAILLQELMAKQNYKIDLDIFATDIDQKAIQAAQTGKYPLESVEDVKYGLLKKHFVMNEMSFQLKPEIKELVAFSFFNLLDKKSYAPPESVFANFDIVLCRNVLIYLEQEPQDIVFEKLYRSLAENGFLVLGEFEIPPIKYQKYFKKVNECCHIYQKQQL